jgi:molybdate transport system ATP-binding protein
MVFQDYRLFPHLSVLENVAFGLRARGTPRAEARRCASSWLERMELDALAPRKPGTLSGGQAQRVALARALATDPRLLLLDEPLAALDAAVRPQVRRELRRHLESFDGTRLLVTHDPLEAITLADRVVVMEAGRVVQAGTVPEITARPRSAYVARLVGLNLFRGHARGDHIELQGGASLVVAGAGTGPVFAVVHPRAVTLHRELPQGTPRNVWRGELGGLDHEGDRVRVEVTGDIPVIAEVTPAATHELRLDEGGPIWVSVKATEIDVYPA